MAAVDEVDELIEQYQLALGEFMKGNPEPQKKLFSHREDVTLANPLFPVGRGWEPVAQRLERAAANFRDGHLTGFEIVARYVTPELAYTCGVRAGKGQGWRKRGYRPNRSAGYDDLSTRRRRLESCASAHRADNHPSASGISIAGVDLPP